MRNFSLVLVLLFCYNLKSIAQNTKKEAKALEKLEQYEIAQNLVNNANFKFQARKALPQKGTQIDLSTSPNFLIINNGNASADLPYFGRAFSGGYGGGGGIQFDGPMENYSMNKNDKKQKQTIKFRVKGAGDAFNCTLTVSGTENVSLSVISNNRQQISYLGFITEISKE